MTPGVLSRAWVEVFEGPGPPLDSVREGENDPSTVESAGGGLALSFPLLRFTTGAASAIRSEGCASGEAGGLGSC